MNSDGSTYYLTYDQVGSLRIVADAFGTVVKRIDYDSFGNIIDDTNPAFEVPFGFAGGLHDRDTGLVRFGYRDYDPDIGRWTAKDPILFEGGDTDLYGYVLNDPINLIDPLGLWGWAGASAGLIQGAIGGGLMGLVQGGLSGAIGGAILGGLVGGLVGLVDPFKSSYAGALVGSLVGEMLDPSGDIEKTFLMLNVFLSHHNLKLNGSLYHRNLKTVRVGVGEVTLVKVLSYMRFSRRCS